MSPTRVVPPLWYSSFYWRIAVSFIALVVTVLTAQSLMVSYLMERRGGPFAGDNPNAAAAAVAARVGAALTTDPQVDLDLLVRTAMPGRQPAYAVLRDGRVAGNGPAPLSGALRQQAQAVLGGTEPAGGATSDRTGPVVSAPIQVAGQLAGLVLLPPPPRRGLLGQAADLLSLPGTLLLLTAGALAGVVIFVPARRRLRALEDAAERFGSGDLGARAAVEGRDEIAGLAQAFNQMAADLEARTTALETSNRLRRQMLADVSHELRTPLTAMRGYLETLAMADVVTDAPTRTRHIATLQRETGRMARMVEDLLDLAKHEQKASSFTPRVVAVERIFEHVRSRFDQQAREAGVTLESRVAPKVDQIFADPDRVEQVISNLVANAIRHTPPDGRVSLAAEAHAGGCRLSVVDTGEGLPAEHTAHVFDRFYKVEASRAGGGGSGLGLSIVKAIAERHGGSVSVESRPGRTAFMVDLPHAAGEALQSLPSAHL